MPSKLKSEVVPINSILENLTNARLHPDRQLAVLQASLKRYGQQTPIVVGKDKLIIKGNGTYRAAKALGWAEIEVVWSELDVDEAKAYGIVDNQSSQLSEWDINLLGTNLQELYEHDPRQDWDAVGFDKEELIPFLGNLSDEELALLGGTAAPPAPPKEDVEMGKPIRVTKEQRLLIDQAIFKIRYNEGDSKMSEGRCVELIIADFLADPNNNPE